MKVGVIGAGPAGLYFSLLMKKADATHDVTVVERNPQDATYGWGVVFSEETLGSLRDADFETYAEISDTFAKWGAIDVRYRGERVRSRGHAFSAIARRRLLGILQRRALELGVDLRFEQEADEEDFADCDLVVGADGVHSRIRERGAEGFQPSSETHATKFAWFGADLAFKAFTFIFRDTPYGLFQVHAYPFDAGTSTFIVECHQDTWRRAGLDGAREEESLRFCEKLFAEDLEGRHLLSNNSRWISFVTLRCESWHAGRLVLLGDAAHTAHFTVGSGTKLAMEDALSLAAALQRHDDVEHALTEYELDRQPVVERFQEAALESAAYFENVRRYATFDPLQFSFNLLTRSGRIGYVNLALRDPRFVASVDRWFARQASAQATDEARVVVPPPMFAPLRLRGLTLANRIVLAPVSEDSAEDGRLDDGIRQRVLAAARAGPGLVLTEMTAVSAEGRITPGTPGMYRREHADAWALLVDQVHRQNAAKIALQLGHAGPRGSTRRRREGVDLPLPEGSWSLLSASPLPYAPWSQVPEQMDRADMERVRERFALAARAAADAGFDVLELNYAHGYLVASFISPLTNRRQDAYGGALADLMRFPLEVLDAVRAVWPADRPLAVAMTATDWHPRGLGADDAVEVAALVKAHGCDVVRVLGGQTTAFDSPAYGRFYLVPFGDRVRNEAEMPVISTGNITTADEVNTILAAGRGDLCIVDGVLSSRR